MSSLEYILLMERREQTVQELLSRERREGIEEKSKIYIGWTQVLHILREIILYLQGKNSFLTIIGS